MRSLQELNSLALKTRRRLGEDSYSPIDIFALVNGWKDKKITIVRYPLSDRISGICTRIGTDIVIGINSRSSFGRQRFTLAHELYHILYEENMERVICDMTVGAERSDSEKEANGFASYLLMPYDSLSDYSERAGKWDIERIIEAEQFFQISHMSMLFRLKMDKWITEDEKNDSRQFLCQKKLHPLVMEKNFICRCRKKNSISLQVSIFVRWKNYIIGIWFQMARGKNCCWMLLEQILYTILIRRESN